MSCLSDLFAITYFAPNINLVRDVRWGRTQETYGECLHLTSRMGTAFVQGVQNQSIRPSLSSNNPYLSGLAMLKHYLAYDLESSFAVGGHSARCVLELKHYLYLVLIFLIVTLILQVVQPGHLHGPSRIPCKLCSARRT
jgi:hypothetical protein